MIPSVCREQWSVLESCLSLEQSKANGLAIVFVVWEARETQHVTLALQKPALSALSVASNASLCSQLDTFIKQETNFQLHLHFKMFNNYTGPVVVAAAAMFLHMRSRGSLGLPQTHHINAGLNVCN